MNNFITEIVFAVIGIIAIVIFILYIVKLNPKKCKELIDRILFALAVEAERLYGSKTGQAKKKQVIAWFYERYKWLSMLISQEKLNIMIDDVVTGMNQWLVDNPAGAANLIGAK